MGSSDRADNAYREYLDRAEYREWTGRPSPQITGYVSSCCRGAIRAQHNGEPACIVCGRTCDTATWHSPMSGSSARGGWDPGKTCGPAVRGPGEQVIYVNPTHVRNVEAETNRRVIGAERIRHHSRLFDPIPQGWTGRSWRRALLAWRRWLRVGDYAEVSELSVTRGADAEVWTVVAVREWIGNSRGVVNQRIDERSIHAVAEARSRYLLS